MKFKIRVMYKKIMTWMCTWLYCWRILINYRRTMSKYFMSIWRNISSSMSLFSVLLMIFPAYNYLLGHRTKGANVCPIYGENTHNIWFKNYVKYIYLGQYRFVNWNSSYRWKEKTFNGNVELDRAPMSLSRKKSLFCNEWQKCLIRQKKLE
jgi:Transposase family tnp2